MKATQDFLKYNWPSITWAAFILWMCLLPASHLPHIVIPYFDKVVHFGFYFMLAALMLFGWQRQHFFSALHRNALLKIIFIASAYGLAIEVMQELFTADRHFEWWDELADACGAVAGGWIAGKLLGRGEEAL